MCLSMIQDEKKTVWSYWSPEASSKDQMHKGMAGWVGFFLVCWGWWFGFEHFPADWLFYTNSGIHHRFAIFLIAVMGSVFNGSQETLI